MSALITIVVIDDEPAIRNGISKIISESMAPSFCVIGQASDGIEGLDMVCRLKPDIVISDIIMPGLTGLELIEEVRKINPKTRFIILSGYDDFHYAKTAISLKVSEYLLKPVLRTDLIKAVMEASSSLEERAIDDRKISELQKSATILFMQRLIKGEISTGKELNSGLSTLSIPLIDKCTTVIVIHFPDKKELIKAEQSVEAFASELRLVTVIDQTNLALVANTDEEGAKQLAKRLLPVLIETHSDFTIGIGCTESSLLKAEISYQKALVAISYRMYDTNRILFSQSDVKDLDPVFSPGDINTDQLLNILISEASDEEVISWCDSLFGKILFSKTPPPSFTRGILIYLITDVNRRLEKQMDIDSNSLKTPDFSVIGRILSVETLKKQTAAYLIELKNTIIPKSRLLNDPIILSTIRYVDNNIKNANISAGDIAKRLNLSDSYFSTLFKTRTGETFRSYVLKRKNEYAKGLLEDSSLSLDDIAYDLGYTDYRSFHRLFKQLNGISPTEYRKGHKK